MKKPNKILEKKYITSLVIAAFLILSVLTAYNIRFGNQEKSQAETEVEETIGRNSDAVRSGEASGEDEGMDAHGKKEESSYGETNESRSADEERGTDGSRSAGEERETDESQSAGGEKEAGGSQSADEERGTDESRSADEERGTDGKQNADEEDASAWRESFNYDGREELLWPVMGNVILPYSMDTTVYFTTLDQYACNDGMLIGAKKGQEVVAAADGRIVNVYDSDRYGTVVTVRIGKEYELTYGQLEDVRLSVGDEVEKGEVLASVADPARTFTLEGPHLYFKMTYKGEPVNPAEYLEN